MTSVYTTATDVFPRADCSTEAKRDHTRPFLEAVNGAVPLTTDKTYVVGSKVGVASNLEILTDATKLHTDSSDKTMTTITDFGPVG